MFKVAKYGMGSAIITEGSPADQLFWIIEGSCAVSRTVPFLSLHKTLSAVPKGYQAAENEKIVTYHLETQVIQRGDWFPCLMYSGKDKDLLGYDDPQMFDRPTMIAKYLKGNIENPFNVTATTKCIVASIKCNDFLVHATPEILHGMVVNPKAHEYPIESIQQTFIEQRAWEDERKNMIQDLYQNQYI